MVAVRDLRAEVARLDEETNAEPLTDVLAQWLAVHYVAALQREVATAGKSGINLKTLHGLTADVVALRRGDHETIRLSLERERLELERQEKVDAGLEALSREMKSIPGAVGAFKELSNLVKRETLANGTNPQP